VRCSNRCGHRNSDTVKRPHRSRVQTQRPDGSDRAARVALNLRRSYLKSKDFLKKTCGSIAIQSESFWRRSPDHISATAPK
jgi:hypothetical protein